MAATVPVIPHIALDDTLGAAFLGHTVTTFLYGITTLQTFLYYRDQYKDPLVLRASVAVLWILDSVHAGLITGALYWYCITNFTNLPAVQRPIWPIPLMIIISTASNSIVRGIYAYRLYKLARHRLILPSIIWGLYAGLSVEAAVDLVVAIAQCVVLRRYETGIRSINTGMLTSICAIGALVSYAVVPEKFIYFAFFFALSKLYVNSLLATLNARGSLLGHKSRREQGQGREKVAFRTPEVTVERTNNSHPTQTAGIEFTSVFSGPGDMVLSSEGATDTTTTVSQKNRHLYDAEARPTRS
ncbi:hypothetical protein C8Q80DRAFT_1274982 [Daedaleopsis nitida]|nr:hypothetical protein C8Q80DRAFT_1274982 [Daedaleopsis nitida]